MRRIREAKCGLLSVTSSRISSRRPAWASCAGVVARFHSIGEFPGQPDIGHSVYPKRTASQFQSLFRAEHGVAQGAEKKAIS